MKRLKSNVRGHEIEIAASRWNGKEAIRYDGRVVSEKRNLKTFIGAHGFEVEEDGERVTYEVNVLAGFGIGFIVRRNGVLVDARP